MPRDYQVSSGRSILPTWHSLRGRLGGQQLPPGEPSLACFRSALRSSSAGALLRGRVVLSFSQSCNARERPGGPRLLAKLPYKLGHPAPEPSPWGRGHKRLSCSECPSQPGKMQGRQHWEKNQGFPHLFLEEDIGEGRSGLAQCALQGCSDLWPGKHNGRSAMTPRPLR